MRLELHYSTIVPSVIYHDMVASTGTYFCGQIIYLQMTMQAQVQVNGRTVIVTDKIIQDYFKRLERYTDNKDEKILIVAIEWLAIKGLKCE